MSEDKFKTGDNVRSINPVVPDDPFFWHDGHILGPGFMTRDDEESEPYKVYPVQMQGGRGVGGYFVEANTIPCPDPQEPAWPIT